MSYEVLEVKPLTLRIGAEIGGVDLTKPLSNRQTSELRDAIADYQVIFSRDQPLDHESHIRFGRVFGDQARAGFDTSWQPFSAIDFSIQPSLQVATQNFVGGSLATGRNTLGDNATDWLKDGTAVTSNQWGSPMYEGGLMAMCDGTVRIFTYSTPLTNFLLPDDGNEVELP